MKNASASGIARAGHAQRLEDWRALLDFADWQLLGKVPARTCAPDYTLLV